MKNTIFTPHRIPKNKEDYHGSCRFHRFATKKGKKAGKSVSVEIEFPEALKLSLAIQASLMTLNRMNKGKITGKQMGILLSIKSGGIAVIDKKLGKAQTKIEL